MRVVIAAGGTGGHLYPGLAVAEALLSANRRNEILFIGGADGPEGKIVPRYGFSIRCLTLPSPGYRLSRDSLRTLWSLPGAVMAALRIMREFMPRILVATGGYLSLPVVFAASLRRLPVFLLEQNVLPGVANRLAAPLASRIAVTYPETLRFFPVGKTAVIGNPVRQKIITARREDALVNLNLTANTRKILVMGGSQGAASLNRAAIEMTAEVTAEDNFEILHISGERDYSEVEEKSREAKNYHLWAYQENVEDFYAVADLVVGRAGATFLAEIAARGLPSILVPYPYAAEGHQLKNAAVFEKAGAAKVIEDNSLRGKLMTGIIRELLADPEKLEQMGAAAKALGQPDAANRLVEGIYDLVW